MLRARREGPTRRPNAIEWSLDGILVGVGAVRVLRELFRKREHPEFGSRAWDMAGWSGVTTQGTNRVLERFEAVGLVHRRHPAEPGKAHRWSLNSRHPLYDELEALFEAERRAAGLVRARTLTGVPDA